MKFQIFINQIIYTIILNEKEWMQEIDIIDLNTFGMNFWLFQTYIIQMWNW